MSRPAEHVQDWRVGSYFLTFHADGKPRHQGYVKRCRVGGAFEVVLFSWLSGEPNGSEVQPESYFAGATFFPSSDDLIAAAARTQGQDPEEALQFNRNWLRAFGRESEPKPEPMVCKERRAKSREATKKIRFRVFMRDGFKCRYCGRAPPQVVLHVDHVVPLSKGGDDSESNLAASCPDCNQSKAAKILGLVPNPSDMEGG